jgi:RNA recognition motif-containing protein
MPTKLYIGNVSSSVNSTELKELFEKYGKVLECDIIKDYAFVVRVIFLILKKNFRNKFFSSIWKMQVKLKQL